MWQHCLFVGPKGETEFAEALGWLERHGRLDVVPDAGAARQQLRGAPRPPGLVVLGQTHPGQYAPSDIEQLHGAAPLARLILLLGSWCDGETCSGQPVPGVVRLFWHELVAFLESQRRRPATAAWSLPRTASDAERLEFSCHRVTARGSGLVVIAAATQGHYEGLADGCLQAGYSTLWLRGVSDSHVRGVRAALWDDSAAQASPVGTLPEFVRQVHPAPVIALLSFPRSADTARAASAGVSAVLAKPFLLDGLLALLGRVTPAPSVQRNSIPA